MLVEYHSVYKIFFFCSLSAVSAFFNASCVPGAGTMIFSSLCSTCQGQRSYDPHRNFYCETSHNEPFYHNQGALRFKHSHTTYYKNYLLHRHTHKQIVCHLHFFRCLKSGVGDVAFVDHTSLDSIDG